MKPKNQINIEEQFLKMYVEKASREELEHIDQLLDQKDYEEIDRIVEEYTYRIINNRDLKDLGTESDIESFMFQGASQKSKIIYFDKIKLVKFDCIDYDTCSDSDDPVDDESDKVNLSNSVNISYLFRIT